MFKKVLYKIYKSTENSKEKALKDVLKRLPKDGTLLDVGCWDGIKTEWWAKSLKSKKLVGLEVVKRAAMSARKRGIDVYISDIDKRWPIKSNSIDIVLSNLVIEHISDVDNFISESYRVLKKTGYSVVCTNNLSSWHNIISLLFGWAPFDLTNSSIKRWSIGNPIVLHKNENLLYGRTFTHKCIYTTRWLREWYEQYGFRFVGADGVGYYPLPSFIGKFDKTHAAYIILTVKK